MQPSFLELSENRKIAYVLTNGKSPCVVFLSGFKSDMKGTKASFLEAKCREAGQMFIRFDYTGHGLSSGNFKDGTIGAWKKDALDVINHVTSKEIMLVGSSMGAWLALLLSQEISQKLVGLVGIASAPDFTEKLIWEKLKQEDKQTLMEQGVYYAPSCYGEESYPIMRGLIEEARNHLITDRDIKLELPVRLLHGTNDADVPWQISAKLLENISSNDATLTLIKSGDHRLSNPEQLEMMWQAISSLRGM